MKTIKNKTNDNFKIKDVSLKKYTNYQNIISLKLLLVNKTLH